MGGLPMPYGSNSDLPPGVRDKYSDRCQSVFRRVFNSNHGDGEEKAFRVAHTAARRCMEAKSVERDALPNAKFNILSGMLKALPLEEGGPKGRRVKTVATSTLTDRQGDQMTLKALQAMAASAEGMTVFLNHSYKVPEDVFGVVKGAEIIQRDEEYDLDFDIEVEEDNPRALATHKSVERGVKLGTSIGAIVKEAYKDRSTGTVVIDDVVLLEASIVGIPANPRTFVQYAVKALNDAQADESDEPAQSPDTTSANDAPDNATLAREEGDEAVASPPPAESVDNDTQPEATTSKAIEPEVKQTEPEAAQEGEEPTPESSADGRTKDIEPEKKPIPASALDSDVVGEQAKALLAIKQADFTTLLKMVESATSELVETKKALWDVQKQAQALERERDEAKANVELAKQFVNKLAELPIGRRASHAVVIDDFNAKFGGIYDPDFIKMLTSGDNTNG